MPEQSTVVTTARIDVSPDGIKVTFDGLDTDLARLMEQAKDFEVDPIEFNSFDSSNVYMKSKKVIQFVDPPTS